MATTVIKTKEQLKEYLKNVPDDAVVHINGGCCTLSWSEKMSDRNHHGHTVVIENAVLEDN